MTQPTRFRRRESNRGVTTLELFYDLVFVFAVTQVSHLLLADLTWRGAGQAALALLVVWWSWNYTTWVTNELDPDATAVRLLLIGLMLASLVMAVAIPRAFAHRGLLFAGAYVVIQVGRHTFLTFVSARPGTIERTRAGEILTWFVAAGVFWLAGGLAHGGARTALWLAALAIDYAGPLFVYRVPGRPRLDHVVWQVDSGHFAERFQLFVIIALGESIVIIGATATPLELTAARLVTLGLSFLATAAMWWLYFDYAAAIAERRLELSEQRTRLARDAYTYLHVAIAAAVIVTAVGDELAIAHPTDTLPDAEVAAIAAGPALYLIALVLFRRRMAGSWSRKRLTAAAGCMLIFATGGFAPGWLLEALTVAVLTAVIVAERRAALRRIARGEPSPLERLEAVGHDL
jgi:low temperature requirement protein LtrA